MDSGFDRLSNNMSNLDNQAKQSNASLSMLGGTTSKILKTFIGLGIAGLTAMTVLAAKSPVLAGTMAKIEVETLKLSNTLGRQLKPVFEAIANDLIPAINRAFSDNEEGMGIFVEQLTTMVNLVSDLIGKDWVSLLSNLEKLFGLGKDEEMTTETQKKLGGTSEYAETVMAASDLWRGDYEVKPSLFDPTGVGGTINQIGKIILASIIDTIQYTLGTNNVKEQNLISVNGIPR